MPRATNGTGKKSSGPSSRRAEGKNQGPFDAFLSHSSQNKRLATRLEKGLTRSGLKVWIDRANIRAGGLLLDALQDALVDSRNLVLLWSKPASASRYVAAEWQAAWHLDKGIIPCRLDDTPFPPFLLRYRCCDFEPSYDSGLAELVAALGGRNAKKSIAASRTKATKQLAETVREICSGQENVLASLHARKPQMAARFQADLNTSVRTAVRTYPQNPLVLALAGYHKKNAYMIERDQGLPAKDRLLEEAEQRFLAALSVQPDDPSALNGIGSVLVLRGELDAAEFYVRCAIDRARKDGASYAAAEHDLRLIQELKRQRTSGQRP
jgi:hypothetical protein